MHVALENIRISKLRNNTGQIEGLPRNPRFIKDARYAQLLKSIRDDPEMLALKELWVVPHNGSFVVIAGNMRLNAFRELKMKDAPCKIIPSDTPVQKLRAFAIKDNVSNGLFDLDLLANEWDESLLRDWAVDIPHTDLDDTIIKEKQDRALRDNDKETDEKEAFYRSMLNDCLYESDNMYDIPVLKADHQAGKLLLPFAPWGADSRLRKDIATYHFYVDDYRFEALFKDPVKLLVSGVTQVVEPNLSLYDTTPVAYGLHLIYKKRWLARYFQDCNISIYVDLNVSRKFYEYNQLGVPQGWDAFFTRGYNDRLEYLKEVIDIARKISQKQTPNMIIYGGGKKIKEYCVSQSLLYTEQFMEDH